MGVGRFFTKRARDQFIAAFDFRPWPLNDGETVLDSNARGDVGLLITDEAGDDVTATVSGPDAPWVANGRYVSFWFTGGGPPGAQYTVEATAPTSDGELLTAVGTLHILP